MKDRVLRFACLALAALAPCCEALTLDEARDRAAEHNRDILSSDRQIDVADGQRESGAQFPNPSLGLGVSRVNADGRGSGTSAGNGYWQRSWDTNVSITQPIPVSGRLARAEESGRASTDAAKARSSDARRVTDDAVTRAYAEVAAARESAVVLRETAGSLRQEAGIAAKRRVAGDLAETDEARITLEADRADIDVANGDARVKNAVIALETLLGDDNPKGGTPVTDSLATMRPLCERAEALAIGERPDVEAAKNDATAAHANVELERANRWADPSLTVSYDHSPPDAPNTVGLAVSIPLPLFNRNDGAIRAARAQAEIAENEVGRAQSRRVGDLASARETWRAALAAERRHTERLLPDSERIARISKTAYERGAIPLIDYLSTTRAYNDERLAAVQAARDLLGVSADLAAAKGSPLPRLTSATPSHP